MTLPVTQTANASAANRRTFLKGTAAAVVAGSTIASLAKAAPVHVSGDETLKVGLIGCGGRGTGAAVNAMRAHPQNKLTALCDIFPDRVLQAKKALNKELADSGQFAVEDDHCFSDFDGYKKLLETDVDVICLCTTPHFRPAQLKASIEAGKHVFCEKPVAVDAPGVRSVLETTKLAKQKNLSIVSGLCWRYDLAVLATIQKIKDGAIGEIRTIQENYLTGELWHRGRNEMWSEMEYQIRNWLYFTWLSGDHIAEQHIHSLDKALWLMDDKPPARCYGMGGRQRRVDQEYGNIFDHFATVFEWENGVRAFSFTRQQNDCFNETDDIIFGTKGSAKVLQFSVTPNEGLAWKYEGPTPSMYDLEHVKLFEGIRKGEPINNGEYMSYSTMMAIMGREACYSGEMIEWDRMMASDVVLGPKDYAWGDVPVEKIAIPGKTKSAQVALRDMIQKQAAKHA
jgi:myo-inositol 2-dehydrogenase / D-chiro-inositol 1-dehydrogenase